MLRLGAGSGSGCLDAGSRQAADTALALSPVRRAEWELTAGWPGGRAKHLRLRTGLAGFRVT